MDTESRRVVGFFIFILGCGVGFYVARFFF